MNLYRKLFGRMMDEVPADGSATGGAPAAPVYGSAAPAAPAAPAGEAAPGEGETPPGDGDAPAEKVVPETYEIKGSDTTVIDDEVRDLFQSTSKELKLSQEEADRVASIGFKIVERQQAAALAEVEKWKTQVENDPELGGAKLTESHAIAEAGVDAIASPELKQILIQTGMSNHPAVFKAFYKLGMMVKDDSFVLGGSRGAQTETSRAERMFGKKS